MTDSLIKLVDDFLFFCNYIYSLFVKKFNFNLVNYGLILLSLCLINLHLLFTKTLM